MSQAQNGLGSLVNLNVGGKRFSTSRETLTWIGDTFFTSLLSGRISSSKDEQGCIFIDRDPKLFRHILNFLRTKEVETDNINVKALKREAEYFGIHPLVSRLTVCEELDRSTCGNVLFHGMLQRPTLPQEPTTGRTQSVNSQVSSNSNQAPLFSEDKKTASKQDVLLIAGHHNWLAVAYAHCVLCYKVKESCGWQQVFTSPYLPRKVRRVAINAKVQGMAPDSKTRMVAVAFSSSISLWSFQDEVTYSEIGTFDMSSRIEALFFIGSQLVSTGRRHSGHGSRVGVWNAVSQHWQTQDVASITSYDSAGSFLLLGGDNGSIHYIDMQKFPLRMADNDLLITELYRDPSSAIITALSVFLTPKNSATVGNWIEVAYGTATGAVCVIVQHPELVGQGMQLFQTFTVHRNPVYKVMLSEKNLVSVCSDNNHVRAWKVTRFRGMISTQPGSTPLASFKILALDPLHGSGDNSSGNNIGPHGEREEVQVFIQKLFPLCDQLYVRASSNGDRIAEVKSVDGSPITCFCLHECEASSRMGSRPRRYLFTGHANGTIQTWDMTTALDLFDPKSERNRVLNSPTKDEVLRLLGQCDLLVSPRHVPSCSANRPSEEMSELFKSMLLRSSNQSLASLDSLERVAIYSAGKGEAERCWCDDNPGVLGARPSASKSFSEKRTFRPPPSPQSQHKRGQSESSALWFREQSSLPTPRHCQPSQPADAPSSPPSSPQRAFAAGNVLAQTSTSTSRRHASRSSSATSSTSV